MSTTYQCTFIGRPHGLSGKTYKITTHITIDKPVHLVVPDDIRKELSKRFENIEGIHSSSTTKDM